MILVNGEQIEKKYFPDHTFLLMGMKNSFKKEYLPAYYITWKYENEEEFAFFYYIVKFFKEQNAEIILNIPYLPNARMDRVQNDSEIFTLKYFCEFINDLQCKQVNVFDVHSNVALALINNVVNIYPQKLVKKVNELNPDVIFYPDEGSIKRYNDKFKYQYAFGIKRRDWRTGKILSLDIIGESVKNKNIVIIDDISSYGGTFYYSALKLKDLGANDIYLVVTHCENSILDGELIDSDLLKKIYTTDSIFTEKHNLIEVIEI